MHICIDICFISEAPAAGLPQDVGTRVSTPRTTKTTLRAISALGFWISEDSTQAES